MTDDVLLREAVEADIPEIVRLANLLSAAEGKGDDVFSERRVRADGFGDDPAFTVLLAERDGAAVGYALYVRAYNTDLAARAIFLDDLFVVEQARGRGIGRRLLAEVAAVAVAAGATSVWWGVRSANRRARAFYARLGARDEDARILELDGDALTALAESADGGPGTHRDRAV
ncbi:MAG: GNAT family N-acetyltransferase [Alphaproteobacteria bacterium]